MGAASSLPDDALVHTGKFLRMDRKTFLSVRATSVRGRRVVQELVATRWTTPNGMRFGMMFYVAFGPVEEDESEFSDEEPEECAADPRSIEALGRVFGPSYAMLQSCGKSEETLQALRSFVLSANGGLISLDLRRSAVSNGMLVEFCRSLPNLRQFYGPEYVSIADDDIEAISVACPNLKVVELSQGMDSNISPAESWARLFPKLRTLSLSNGQLDYTPSRLDAIRESAHLVDVKWLEIEGCHITRDVVEAIVGTPLGDRLEDFGTCCYQRNNTLLEPEAILAAAAGFPRLSTLEIPEGTDVGAPDFYVALGRAATQLRSLVIRDRYSTDAHVAAACAHCSLRMLELNKIYDVTPAVVECIVGSGSAATLEELRILGTAGRDRENSLHAVDILRLVEGCPRLKTLYWFNFDSGLRNAELDRDICRQITELLLSRRDGDGGTEPWEATAANIFLGAHSTHVVDLHARIGEVIRVEVRTSPERLSQDVVGRRALFERTLAVAQQSDEYSEQSDAESESEEEQA